MRLRFELNSLHVVKYKLTLKRHKDAKTRDRFYCIASIFIIVVLHCGCFRLALVTCTAIAALWDGPLAAL